MTQHDPPPLSEDQLREPPTVHLATGMIAAEREVSCAEAFEVLHERALDDGSLAAVAQKVVRGEIPASCDGGSASDRRSFAVRQGRWAIRNSQDLTSP